MKNFSLFFLGVFLIAGVIGLLTGLTASPVVSVLIPLIFSLLTAGGAVYVERGMQPSGTKAPPGDRRKRASVLGLQLVAFSLGFLVGLWPGSAAKLHPEKVWFFEGKVTPAYGEFHFEDLRVLTAVIALDEKMKSSGLALESRRTIIEAVYTALRDRMKANGGTIVSSDLEAVRNLLGLPTQPSTRPWSFHPVAENFEQTEKPEGPGFFGAEENTV